MPRRTPVALAVALALALSLTSCASPAASSSPAAAPAATVPSESEVAIACGLSRVRELAPEGYFATRAEAVQTLLTEFKNREDKTDRSGIPNAPFIEMLTSGLTQLPDAERAHGPAEAIRIDVTADDEELGFIEISPNAEGAFGVTMYGLSPTDPALCEKYDTGDFGG